MRREEVWGSASGGSICRLEPRFHAGWAGAGVPEWAWQSASTSAKAGGKRRPSPPQPA